MCSVSYVGDHYSQKPNWPMWPQTVPFPPPATQPLGLESYMMISQKELAELRKQVEEMRIELIEAKRQDIADGNPDCEMEEKVVILKQIAKLFNIELNEVFPDERS